MKPLAATLALLLIAGSPAVAAVAPVPGVADPRIQTVAYDSEEVVLLNGYLGYQTMIEFEPDERIENVSIGDAPGWQVTPNHKANLLFVKPMSLQSPTNMTVVTNRRSYAFELRSRRGGRDFDADIPYVVRFLYPNNTPFHVIVARQPSPPPERRNINYSYTGSRASLPSEVFDDGHFTYFRWPDNASIPALFLLAADGSESIVNSTIHDGYQIVEQVAPRFKLRDGKAVTVVINGGWRDPTPGALAPRPADARTARAAAGSDAHEQ